MRAKRPCPCLKRLNKVTEGVEKMEELIRTNNVVTLSFVATLLKEAGIRHFIADENMSVLDGSINALSRRLMVDAERANEARQLVEDAGLGPELREK